MRDASHWIRSYNKLLIAGHATRILQGLGVERFCNTVLNLIEYFSANWTGAAILACSVVDLFAGAASDFRGTPGWGGR